MNPMTVTEAATLPVEEIEELGPVEVLATPAQIRAAGELWAALLGVARDDAEGRRQARDEVAGDIPLLVMLSTPASEFLTYWRRAEWEHFPRSDDLGEGWAWGVLDRVRAAGARLGPYAVQVPLRADLVG